MTDPTPQKSRPLIDLNAMTNAQRAYYDSLSEDARIEWLGYGTNTLLDFDVPEFEAAPWEKVVSQGNAFIVYGRDREGGVTSGFGGQHASHCGAIDIVAGRKGFFAGKRTKKRGVIKKANTDFVADAARVYVSQRSDPDGYFRINPGVVGNTSMNQPRSTVVVKADTVRMVARENIKLVTRTDNMNSQGSILDDGIKSIYGIDLMAMNGRGGQQPLVKGVALTELLVTLIQQIQKTQSIMGTYVQQNRKLFGALMKHTHHGAFLGSSSAPDFAQTLPKSISTLINNVTNVDVGIQFNNFAYNQLILEYLMTPGGIKFIEIGDEDGVGTKYILSEYNTTN